MSSVEEVIRTKRAVRQFAATLLPDAAVEAILRAGHYAQSSKNGQPWHFIAIRDRETLRRLSQTGDFAGHLAGAALGVGLVAPVDEPERDRWIMFDLGQAASYMQLEAWELGIGSCISCTGSVGERLPQPSRRKRTAELKPGSSALVRVCVSCSVVWPCAFQTSMLRDL